MSEYKIHKDECGDIEECASCYSQVPLKKYIWKQNEESLLCVLCANTQIGAITRRARDEHRDIAITIAQVAHILLAKLGVK